MSEPDIHRRAQKAEGAVAAVRAVLSGWEKTFEGHGPQLPQHDFLIKTVRRELEKAIARAGEADMSDKKPVTPEDASAALPNVPTPEMIEIALDVYLAPYTVKTDGSRERMRSALTAALALAAALALVEGEIQP